MARPPRGGFRPAELRGTLGSLLKSTLAQAGVVRDVLERGAREGRSRLDEARAGRRRHDALAELGEAVLELIRRGEIDLAEIPEVREVVADLDELDASAGPRSARAAWGRSGAPDRGWGPSGARDDERDPWDDDGSDHDREPADLGDVALPSSRRRFDDRGSRAPARVDDRGGSGGLRRPAPAPASGDGTVSSSRWAPPSGATPRKPEPRVWRPTGEPAAGDDSRGALTSSTPTIPQLPKAIARAHKGGGITFDDDDDLADYMHPDDVPAKPPSDE